MTRLRIGLWAVATALVFSSLFAAALGTASGQSLERAVFVNNVDILPYAPIYIALERGYFHDEGVDVEYVLLEGQNLLTALRGGSAHFAAVGTGVGLRGSQVTQDFVAVYTAMGRLTMNLVLNKRLAMERGLSQNMPLEERLKALRGLRFGVAGLGEAADNFTRYYLRLAGLDPETDATIIDIGGGPALLAALQRGQIDGFMLSPPVPETAVAGGYGELFIAPTYERIPGLDNFNFLSIFTTRKMIEERPHVVRGVARALGRANNFILDHRDEALAMLSRHFSQIDRSILEMALENLAGAIPRDGMSNQEAWENAIRIYREAGVINRELSAEEGILWTNEFLLDLNGRSD